MFSLETGLLLSTRGYKYTEQESSYEYSETATSYNINIPVTAKASFSVGGPKIYGLLGPYFRIGLSGKIKWNETECGITSSWTKTIKWGPDSENDDLKRFDFGLLAGVGAEINSFKIEMSYGLGMANISSYTGDSMKVKNRVLYISLCYVFGGK